MIAPPIPTRTSSGGRPSSGPSWDAIASRAAVDRLLVDGPVEPEPLGDRHRAEVEAEALLHAAVLAEGELGAAAAGLEHADPPRAEVQRLGGREVGEPSLLLARDHLDVDARALADGIEELVRVRGLAQARRADHRDLLRAGAPRLVGQLGDRVDGPPDRLLAETPGLVDPLPQPGHLGAVDDRPPLTVSRRSPTFSLTELVPTSIAA